MFDFKIVKPEGQKRRMNYRMKQSGFVRNILFLRMVERATYHTSIDLMKVYCQEFDISVRDENDYEELLTMYKNELEAFYNDKVYKGLSDIVDSLINNRCQQIRVKRNTALMIESLAVNNDIPNGDYDIKLNVAKLMTDIQAVLTSFDMLSSNDFPQELFGHYQYYNTTPSGYRDIVMINMSQLANLLMYFKEKLITLSRAGFSDKSLLSLVCRYFEMCLKLTKDYDEYRDKSVDTILEETSQLWRINSPIIDECALICMDPITVYDITNNRITNRRSYGEAAMYYTAMQRFREAAQQMRNDYDEECTPEVGINEQ